MKQSSWARAWSAMASAMRAGSVITARGRKITRGEFAGTVRVFGHRSAGGVLIFGHYDTGVRA